MAYTNLLSRLNKTLATELFNTTPNKTIYHLGESHCLSYAHQIISIQGSNYRIIPKIIFGAKAFHFTERAGNKFKAITKANFSSIPNESKVFLSFGEIDCRKNEGIILAAVKLNQSIDEVISNTVKGYIDWFAKQNIIKNHQLFFVNIPAPIYDKSFSDEENLKAAKVIQKFNKFMSKCLLQHGFRIIDVFKFTVGSDGFSNGRFHIDQRHLSPTAIPEIEKQVAD